MQTNQIRKTFLSSVKSKLSSSWLPEVPVGDGNNSGGRVPRASASAVVDLGLILSRVKPMTQ